MSKKYQTNEEVLSKLMNSSQHGVLMQGFIMEGLVKFANAVSKAEKPEGWPNMISWEAWQGCALELKEALDKHLNMGR